MMEPPPPSQIHLQAFTSAAPPFFTPISAATLLREMLESRSQDSGAMAAGLTTGIPALDSDDGVLGSGVPEGCVLGISSGSGGGGGMDSGRLLALKMLCRHLMRPGNGAERAVVVDSEGCFDVQALVGVARGCARREFTKGGARMRWREKVEVEGLLERVGISRVFDVEGVWDVLGEMGRGRGPGVDGGVGEGGEVEEGRSQRDEEGGDHGMREGCVRRGGDEEDGEDEDGHRGIGQEPHEPPPSFQPPCSDPAPKLHSSVQEPHSSAPQAVPPMVAAPTSRFPIQPHQTAELRPRTPSPTKKKENDNEKKRQMDQSSSPLSSPPTSDNVDSSPLASQLIIEPSPVRRNTQTVLSQAYSGQTPPPPSFPQAQMPEDESEEEEEPPSSPPIPTAQAQPQRFEMPTAGFEAHMSEAPRSTDDDTTSDSDSSSSSEASPSRPAPKASQWAASANALPPPSILLIDSQPPLLATLFSSAADRVSAHRQLQQLSGVLTSLTREAVNPMTVIILNSTTTPRPERQGEAGIGEVRKGGSVFVDNKSLPSFGAVYEGMVDVSLLVSRVPATLQDAEMLYGGGSGGGVRWTNVVECLRDEARDLGRWLADGDGDGEGRGHNGETGTVRERTGQRAGRGMNREGRWGAFDVVAEGEGEEGELVFRDPEVGGKVGVYREVGFGRRP